jgi:Tfp pilus assembly protein PilO
MALVELINKYKTKVLDIGLIILALIIAGNIYGGQAKQIDSLKEKQEEEIKKNELLQSIAGLEEQVGSYKNLFTERDINLVIGTISNIARASNVNIVSIKPESEEKNPDYIRLPFSLTVGTANYHVLGKFIANVEGAPDLFIIDTVTISPQEGMAAGQNKEFIANLRISTIVFSK